MAKYNALNVKLFNSQLYKLKPRIKNYTEVALIFHQMWVVILMMKLNFNINYYELIFTF